MTFGELAWKGQSRLPPTGYAMALRELKRKSENQKTRVVSALIWKLSGFEAGRLRQAPPLDRFDEVSRETW